ncbi:RING finger protein 207-like isoform X4 [Polyodon spathula]|uniref:RING finger protein 207-like isoform X4 n=1 Tax=Polyodon spathula TaxID=7913 RepID=UPI001B7F114F|nr:RING finger protein 207-like isoform X4 [Polyodon spathula]
MSGGIFSPLDNLYNLDNTSCHPLVCHLCHEQYEQPCLLDCYHTFCASCLRGRALDGRLTCPLCRHQSIVKGINALPPEDKLLKFLVDNSADCEESVQCANCDLDCKKQQDVDAMYYCNTCNQPLCGACREDTHKAKMFSRHEIVSLAKRTKEIHKKCPLHEELYIMFSTEKKSMLCINCFRDTQVESRAHCIDIETAYMQGCERLDQAVLAVKELQTSAREAIVLLKAMIGEVRDNVDEEETAISTLFNNMQEKLAERKKILLKAARSQHEEKERAFKEQLTHLAALLPTLQVHLVSCSAFLSSANKFEFLDLGYQLMERLKKIVKLPHRLRPTQSCKINTEYRSEFARCLEPLLQLSHRRSVSLTGGGGAASGISNASALLQSPLSLMVPSSSDMSLSAAQKPTAHRYISTRVLLAEGDETPFTEHCRSYENMYRIWEETFQRVANEQEIYEAQLHDLVQLRQENTYLTNITKQITPYIRSIAKVKERLEPRLKESKELKDDRTETMLHIYDDSAVCSEAQHRNDLACAADESRDKTAEHREKIIDNRSLNILPEESTLKTKDYYRSGKQKNSADTPGRKELPV